MSMSRRPRGAQRREFRVTVKFTADEKTDVQRAAERSGQAIAAYVGQAAIDAADLRAVPAARVERETLKELIRVAGLIRRSGTLLNQAVARLHSTGAPGPDLAPAVAYNAKILALVHDAALAVGRRGR